MSKERLAVVTGANGSIGSEIIRRLQQEDIPVHAVVRRGRGEDLKKLDGVTVFDSGLYDRVGLEEACANATEVYHLPAVFSQAPPVGRVFEEAKRVNVDGLRHVVEAAVQTGVPWIGLASTVAVYGNVSGSVTENLSPHGTTTYAKTKQEAETLLQTSGMPHTIFRLGWVFGPGADIWSNRIYEQLEKSPFFFVGDGTGRIPVVDIRDVATAFVVSAVRENANGQIFNLTAGDLTQQEIADAYAVLTRKQPFFLPRFLALTAGMAMDAYTKVIRQKVPGIAEQISAENIQAFTDANRDISSEKLQTILHINMKTPARTLLDTVMDLNQTYNLGREREIINFFNTHYPPAF